MIGTVDADVMRRCKPLCTIRGEAPGDADLIVAVTPLNRLVTICCEQFRPAQMIGRPIALAEAELLATAVLAGDADISDHPETLRAVCVALVAEKARREIRQAQAVPPANDLVAA